MSLSQEWIAVAAAVVAAAAGAEGMLLLPFSAHFHSAFSTSEASLVLIHNTTDGGRTGRAWKAATFLSSFHPLYPHSSGTWGTKEVEAKASSSQS